MTGLGGLLGGTGGGSIVGGAVVRMFLDTGQFDAALSKTEAQTKSSSSSMGGGFSKFGAIAKAGLITAGIAAVGFGVDAVRSFLATQKVMAQTEAVIRSTGAAAGFTAKDIHEMAQSFQSLTTFEDDAVQSAENILLTFRSIGHGVFPQTTQSVLDLSTALGTDLQAAAIQVGKALNDPSVGLTALRRVGVSFTQEQVHLIQSLQQSGDLMGAQKVILKELDAEFGGSAAAAADTYAGKIQQLSNRWADAKKNAGDYLLQVAFGHQIVLDAQSSQEDWNAAVQEFIDMGAFDAAHKLQQAYLGVDLAQRAAAISAKKNNKELTNFANKTADELVSWQSSATSSMTFVEASFDDLGSAAHVSAAKILRSFDDALNAQRDFERNADKFLGQVAKRLGPDLRAAAGEMVAALADAGPEGAARMSALADASAAMRRRILEDWARSSAGAQSFITDLVSVDAYLRGLTDQKHTINIEVITHYLQTGKI